MAIVFNAVDGRNPNSEGEKEALEWTRKMLTVSQTPEYVRDLMFEYLAKKGNESDIELLQKNRYWDKEILPIRVSGSNVFDQPMAHTAEERLGIPRFFPSVANTGPQASYVREILMKFLEQKELNANVWNWREQVPEELWTMAVSFDADGNPVCNVDLAKYGLSMPVITPKPNKDIPHWNAYTVTFPHEGKLGIGNEESGITNAAETSEPPPPPPAVDVVRDDPGAPRDESPTVAIAEEGRAASPKPPRNLWFWLGIGIVGCVCAIGFLIRKKGANAETGN